MRSQSLSAATVNSTDPFTPAITDREEALARIDAAARALRDELDRAAANGIDAAGPQFRLALRGLAREIAAAARPNRRDRWVGEVLEFIRRSNDVGAYDQPLGGDEVRWARENLARGWAGLLAAMLVAPSWELPEAPAFEAVPDWLWPDFAAWLFRAPLQFSNVDVAAVAARDLKRAQDLERWASRNAGSSSIRGAITAYLEATGATLPRGDALAWRPQAESRGRILARAQGRGRTDYEPAVAPRHGRPLRVGIIGRDFGPRPELFSTLPCFEQLDPKAFDVFLFPLVASDSAEAAYCSRRVRATQVLPEATPARLALLRNAQLDVVVFLGDLGVDWNEVAELALWRVAPLQVVSHRSGFTTGLPEVDLYVSGSECAAAAFTERVGVLRGPAYSMAFARPDHAADPIQVTREEVGLPHDRSVLLAVVEPAGTSQAQLQAWAGILAQTSDTHLAIAFAQEGPGAKLNRFRAAVDRALAAAGVDPTRVMIFPATLARPDETRILISLCDVYLDAGPSRIAGWTAAEALRVGVPVVACGRAGVDAPATMLASIGRSDLIAADLAEYGLVVRRLATERDHRTALRAQIAAAIEATPDFLDSLGASDAFGALLESAFDELSALGRVEFRRQTDLVRCFGVDNFVESVETGLAAHARGEIESAAMESSLALRAAPTDTRVRYLHGLVLHAQGKTARAVDYLLAAVQRADATAPMWYSLALALRDNRQVGEAIQVLETCIRLDHGNVDALMTLHELAQAAGASEIARDVLECLQQVAPEDPRVVALS